jgi:hypothetical protein
MTVQRIRRHSRGETAVHNTQECVCDNSWTCCRSPPSRNEECPQLPPPADPTPSASSASVHDTSESSPPPRKVVCVSVGGVHELCAWKYQEIAGKLCLPVNASCHFSNCLRHQDLRHQRQYAELNVFDAGLCQHSPKRAPRERQSFVIAFCALHWARSQRQLATMSLARYGIVRSLT